MSSAEGNVGWNVSSKGVGPPHLCVIPLCTLIRPFYSLPDIFLSRYSTFWYLRIPRPSLYLELHSHSPKHCTLRDTLPRSHAFLWNQGGNHHDPTTLTFCMPKKLVPRTWCHQLKQEAGSLELWLQWPLSAYKAEHSELNWWEPSL